MKNKYKGSVNTSTLKKSLNEKKFNNISKKVKSFENFWLNGFSPNTGKDVMTWYPDDCIGNRHIHLKPEEFFDSKQKQKWNNWAIKNDSDLEFNYLKANSIEIPSSDTGFLYFVDKYRVAYIYLYFQNNLHFSLKNNNIIQVTRNIDKKLEKEGKIMMSQDKQHKLFSDCWLN